MELRQYQEDLSRKAADILSAKGLCYMAMECRTGKTLTALSTAARYGAFSVLFVTKKKALASVRSDYEALQPQFNLILTNYESVHKVRVPFDFVILDEAHNLGQFPRPSKRQKTLCLLCQGLPVLYLSGTPSPENYSQLYHQLQVCSFSPWRLYPTFYKWAGRFVRIRQRMINGRILNDYEDTNEDLIKADIKPFLLTYTQEQAGFEAEIQEEDFHITMQPETVRTFRTLRKDRVVYLQDGQAVIGDTPAALLNKLHQISGGTVITEAGTAQILDRSKAEAIRDRFEGRKIAIFYAYKAEGALLKETFPNNTDSPEEFQSNPDSVFIAQVRSAREGIRLDRAEYLIFYSAEYSFLSYEQARQRAISKERTFPAKVVFCLSDTGLDEKILEAVRDKQDFTLSYYGKQLLKEALR